MSGMVQSETAVIGGAGNVGMGIVAALLDAGMPTVVIGRDAAKLDALRAQHGHSPLLDIVQGRWPTMRLRAAWPLSWPSGTDRWAR